jgi:[methyl-Co(III) methanol-specific corrinoid protein]:coenzyme M methyltransferase
MVKITEKDRFISILNREEVDRISIACPLQTGTVEMMEATNVFWPEAHYSPEMMAELSYAAHKLAGIESVRVAFCLTVELSN